MKVGMSLALAGLGLVAAAGCAGPPAHHAADDTLVSADAAAIGNSGSTTADVQAGSGFGLGEFGPANAPRPAAADTADADAETVKPPIAPPSCPEGPTVHFDTPEAAMTYLAAAWNRNDLAELCQVTNPNARFLLNDMHREAVNLRLKKCDKVEVGHYSCTFRHDYPAHMHKTGTGRAWLDVAPAANPGWYMTVFEGCG
jgi:hypothetical protein